MNEVLVIEGNEIERVVYLGQPVLSLPMVDKLHQRPEGTARRNFNQNRERFISEKHFYELPYEIWAVMVGRNSSDQGVDSSDHKSAKKGHRGSMIFLTLSGYLMLAKSFTDALSWRIQEVLVDSYFKLRELQSIAKDLLALKAKAESAEEWKDKYLHMHEEVYEIFKRKLIKKPPITEKELETIKDMAAKGFSYREIGRAIGGRSASSIHGIIRDNGIPKIKGPVINKTASET